jgi:hypothetical protein
VVASHSYVTEVADDAYILGGMEIEMPSDQENMIRWHICWAYASEGLPCPYGQVSLHVVHFL